MYITAIAVWFRLVIFATWETVKWNENFFLNRHYSDYLKAGMFSVSYVLFCPATIKLNNAGKLCIYISFLVKNFFFDCRILSGFNCWFTTVQWCQLTSLPQTNCPFPGILFCHQMQVNKKNWTSWLPKLSVLTSSSTFHRLYCTFLVLWWWCLILNWWMESF